MNERERNEILKVVKAVFEIMNSDEFTDAVADFCWNMYMKLLNKGFSSEQAMSIVLQITKNTSNK